MCMACAWHVHHHAQAVALTFVEVFTLARIAFAEVADKFPGADGLHVHTRVHPHVYGMCMACTQVADKFPGPMACVHRAMRKV